MPFALVLGTNCAYLPSASKASRKIASAWPKSFYQLTQGLSGFAAWNAKPFWTNELFSSVNDRCLCQGSHNLLSFPLRKWDGTLRTEASGYLASSSPVPMA